jgi:putative acetyltransferase
MTKAGSVAKSAIGCTADGCTRSELLARAPRNIEFILVVSLSALHQLRGRDNRMLRQLNLADMDEAAMVHRRSFDHALPTLAGLHTPEQDRWFFRERVFTTCQLWGYFDHNELVGIIAFREGWIDQLYVLPSSQGQGVGTALLRVARGLHYSLSLWTFQRNAAARRFYERHGFVLIKETDGLRNEEKEPDAMYSWKHNT